MEDVFPLKVTVELNSQVESDTTYQIRVDYNRTIQWNIQRSEQQVKGFISQLQTDFPKAFTDLDLNSFIDAERVEELVKQVFRHLNSKFWNYDPLLFFLDEQIHRSPLSKMYFGYMESQMSSLQQKLSTFEGRLASIESSASSMRELLLQLSGQNHSAPTVPLNAPPIIEPTATESDRQRTGSPVASNSEESVSSVSNASQEHWVQGQKNQRWQNPSGEFIPGFGLTANDASWMSGLTTNSDLAPNILNTFGSSLTLAASESQANVPQLAIPSVLVNTAVPEEWSVPFQAVMDHLMLGILPHDSQVQYRMSALALLKRQIRSVLGVVAFEVGLFAVRCFLSDDPVKLTLIVNPTQLAWWYTTLAEKLKTLAETPSEMHRLLTESADFNNEELRVIMNHSLRNITCIQDKTPCKILCAIDSLDVEITANNRNELCLLAFLEEVSALIGQNDLLKRSVLLIRAWWQYESASVTGADIRHYISDLVIAIMITAIFNQYHQQINHPFHALLCFLREYSQFDVNTHAISLHGLVAFESESSNQPRFLFPQAPQLVNAEIVERYWKMFNLNDPLNIEPPSGVPKPQLDAASRFEMLKTSMFRALQKFEKRGFNVIHPFMNVNMIGEKFSNRRLLALTKVFRSGYEAVTAVLKQIHSGELPAQELPNRYFPNILKKVSTPWRADAVNNLIPSSPGSDTLWSSIKALSIENGFSRMLQNIQYCNFIADAVLSESAIITFCIDLLFLRGSLPVGEIGKILSEASSVQNLSHRLREKYGGLKKFLERYPELFIFSNDHPFNPHILLRSAVSQENLELIDRGIFPLHLLSKVAKTSNLPRKPPTKPVENPIPQPANLSYGNSLRMGSSAGLPPAPSTYNAGNIPVNRSTPQSGGRSIAYAGVASAQYEYAGQSPSTSTYSSGISSFERNSLSAPRYGTTYASPRETQTGSVAHPATGRYAHAGLVGGGVNRGNPSDGYSEYDYHTPQHTGAPSYRDVPQGSATSYRDTLVSPTYRETSQGSTNYRDNASFHANLIKTGDPRGTRDNAPVLLHDRNNYNSGSSDYYQSETGNVSTSHYGERLDSSSSYLGGTTTGLLSSSSSVIGGGGNSRYESHPTLFTNNNNTGSRVVGQVPSGNTSGSNFARPGQPNEDTVFGSAPRPSSANNTSSTAGLDSTNFSSYYQDNNYSQF